MSFVRTVLGDISPSDLGVTDAHEHVIIAGGKLVEFDADFLLADIDKAVAELTVARESGLRSLIDAMPADCGRNVTALAEISRRAGVNIVAASGLHKAQFYDATHWSGRLRSEQIADLFVADVVEGIDDFDYGGPVVDRTDHRAGVIKVGGSDTFPSDRDRNVFTAAAAAQVRTGVPILTHCEGGLFGVEQVEFLVANGASAAHIALSHVDKVVDRGYHRELAATGARVEFDQIFRWGDKENGTLKILEWLVEDGFTEHILLGLDAARQSYWDAYGGTPGIAYLVDGMTREMQQRGISEEQQRAFYVDNPAATFAFIADDS